MSEVDYVVLSLAALASFLVGYLSCTQSERRVAAEVHSRDGPSSTGEWGLAQGVVDGVKLFANAISNIAGHSLLLRHVGCVVSLWLAWYVLYWLTGAFCTTYLLVVSFFCYWPIFAFFQSASSRQLLVDASSRFAGLALCRSILVETTAELLQLCC